MSPYPDQGARNSRTSSSRPSFGNSSGARGSYGPRDRYKNDRKRPGKFREEKVLPLPVVDPADHSAAFTALGVPVPLLDALVTAGIGEPFPVQTATLPDALAGRDVCGRAPTGSGKTLAYGLAVLGRIERANPTAPKALILVPTRELAKQVAEVLVPYSRVTKRWVTAFFGGAGMARQISDLQRGVDVAVATPGRLLDLINRGEARLDEVTMVVIDEADRMADMGFTHRFVSCSTTSLDRVRSCCSRQRSTVTSMTWSASI
jgi:superfamily II DNA/RNA helicase